MPLRLKDRSQIGREIDCPDCGKRLRIIADAGQVRALPANDRVGLELPRRPGSTTTLRLIWLTTAGLGAILLWLALRPTTPERQIEKADVKEASPEIDVAAIEPVVNPQNEDPTPAAPQVVEAPEPPRPAQAEPPPVAAAAPDDRPIAPDLAPDPPAVDVAAQLSLKLEEFSQTRPVQVRLLLRQIAELSAVPVDLSEVEVEPWKTKLDQAIPVELKKTTVGGVLDDILRQAGLAHRREEGVIFVTPPATGS